MRNFLPLLLVCSASPSSAAPVVAPASAAPAAPIGKWVIEFENERCTAAQAYSNSDYQVALAFQPQPTSSSYYLIVQLPEKIDGMGYSKTRYSVAQGEWTTATAQVVPSTKVGHARYTFYVGRQELEQLATRPDLRVEIEKNQAIYVRLAHFPAVLKTLKKCEAGLLADWGLSLEAQNTIASFPKPKGNYFHSGDYPKKALDRSAVGAIEARMTVNKEGRATDCHIIQSSGHKDLDAATCANYPRRARFEPARDHSGSPIVSPYVLRITWRVE